MWGEGGYAKIRPGRAHAGEECPDTWSAAFGHQGQVQSWDGAEELLRSFDSTPNPHTQELPHVQPGKFPKTELRKKQRLQCWTLSGLGADFLHHHHYLSALAPFQSTLHHRPSDLRVSGGSLPAIYVDGRESVQFSLIFLVPGQDRSIRCLFI